MSNQSPDYKRGYSDGMRRASQLINMILAAYKDAEQLVTAKIRIALERDGED